MKRAFPQNPTSVSNLLTDIPSNGVGQDITGNNGRFKTSAAMLGLALSVGASGTFLAKPGEAVGAVIPKDALALASATSSEKFSMAAASQAEATAVFHTVEPGETFWEIAAAHQVAVKDIKAANGIAPEEVLQVGQVLRVPTDRADASPVEQSGGAYVLASLPAESMGASSSDSESVASLTGDSVAPLSLPLADDQPSSPEKLTATVPQLELSLSSEQLEASSTPTVGGEMSSTPMAATEEPLVPSVLPSTSSEGDPAQRSSQPVAAANVPADSAGVEMPSAIQPGGAVSPTPELVVPDKSLRMASIAEPSSPSEPALQILPESAATYQVRPGDTVWTIASAYGVAPDKLVEQNPQLSDPDLIRAGQSLQVPTRSASAVQQPTAVQAEPRTLDQAEAPDYLARIREAAANPMDRNQLYAWIEASQQRTSASVSVAEPAPASVPSTAEVTPQASSTEATESSAAATQESSLVPEPAAEMSAEAQDPHVANLISEIRDMQRQRSAEVAVLTPPASAPQLPSEGMPINPEFAPDAGSAEVDLPESASEDLLAAAPLSSEAYMPRPVMPVGETVSPDLPILPQPSEFLPEAPNRFDGYIWPAQGVLTSGYGWRWGRMHRGVDVAGPVGTPIFAAASGVVVRAGWNSGGYGNLVDIRHPDGSLTRYAHNSRLNVQTGQEVRQGQQIAEMGSTGYSTGPHLHFEIHLPEEGTVNPIAHLPSR